MCSRICGVSGTRVADSCATPVFSLPESPPLPGGLLAQGAKTPLEEDFLCSFLLRTVQETTEKAELGFEELDTQTVCMCVCWVYPLQQLSAHLKLCRNGDPLVAIPFNS